MQPLRWNTHGMSRATNVSIGSRGQHTYQVLHITYITACTRDGWLIPVDTYALAGELHAGRGVV